MKTATFLKQSLLSVGVLGSMMLSSFALADPNIDLGVSKSSDVTQASAGESITYTLEYTNEGSVVIPDATTEIKDFSNNNQIDLNTISFGAMPTGDFCAVVQDPDPLVAIFQGLFIKCDIGEMAVGETRSITYTVNLSSNAGNSGTVTNTARGTTANEEGSNISNNTSVQSIQLVEADNSTVDVSVSKNSNTTTVASNSSVTYTVSVTNSGDATATGVELTDFSNNNLLDINSITFADIPDGVCAVTVDPDPLVAIFQGSYVFCDLEDIPAGATTTFSYTMNTQSGLPDGTNIVNMARVSARNETDSTKTNNNNSNTISIGSTQTGTFDISVSKSANKTTVNPGDTITYTIEYTNNGTLAVSNAQLKDVPTQNTFDTTSVYFADIPDGACGVTTDPDPLVTIFQGAYILCDLPTIQPGETSKVTYTLTVADNLADGDRLVNTANIDVDGDTNVSNNRDTNTVTVEKTDQSIDLGITKTSDKTQVIAGDTITYTIEYTNTGNTTATGITLKDIPTQDTFDFSTLTFADIPDGACGITVDPDPLVAIFQGSYIFCDVPDIAAGETTTFTYTVQTLSTLPEGKKINNMVTIHHPDDTNVNNNSSNQSITVVDSNIDIAVTKTADKQTVSPGEDITYTITYTNNGDDDATDLSLNDSATEGLDLSTLYFTDIPDGACGVITNSDPLITLLVGAEYIFCTLEDLAAGKSNTFSYTVTVEDDIAIGTEIINTAQILINDSNQANNKDTQTVTVVATTPTPTPTPTITATATPAATATTVATATPEPTTIIIGGGSSNNGSSSSGGNGGGGGCNAEATLELDIIEFVQGPNGQFVEADSEEGAIILAKNTDNKITYKIQITNDGDASAYEVEVNSKFVGENGIVQSDISNVNGATYAGGVFVVSKAIPANGAKEFTFEAIVNTSDAGTASHTSTIQFFDKSYTCPRIKEMRGMGNSDTSYFTLGVVATPVPTVIITPTQDAQPISVVVPVSNSTGEAVRLSKSANKDVVNPGDEIIFTLSITNTGTEDLKSVNMYDIFPSSLEPTDAVIGNLVDAETIRFKQKFLPIGATFTRNIPMRVKGSALPGSEIVNIMKVGTQNVEIKEDARVTIKVADVHKAAPVTHTSTHRPTYRSPKLVQTGLETPMIPLGVVLMIGGVYIYRRRNEMV